MAAKKAAVTVLAAVERDLKDLAKRDKRLAESAEAAAALAIARDIDSSSTSPNAKAMLAKELRDTLAVLYARAPVEEAKDSIDELSRRRAARRAAP